MCAALTLQLVKFCNVFEMASLWGIYIENLLLPLPLRLVDLADVPTTELVIIAFGTLTQRVLKGVGSNGEDLPAEYKHTQKESSNTQRLTNTSTTMQRLGSAAQRAVCVGVRDSQESHVHIGCALAGERLQDLPLQDQCWVDVPNLIWPENWLP